MRQPDPHRARSLRALLPCFAVRHVGGEVGRGRDRVRDARDRGQGMTLPISGTLVLLGCGKMGGAMLEGWLKAGADPAKIAVFDPAPPSEAKALIDRHAIRHNPPVSSIRDAEVLLVAVKPQIMDEALAPILGL